MQQLNIGEREIIHTVTLILKGSEVGKISFDVGGAPVAIEVGFISSEPASEASEPTLSIETETGMPVINFINWSNILGTSTSAPIRLGRLGGQREFSFMATHWRIGDTNKLDIQFALGPAS